MSCQVEKRAIIAAAGSRKTEEIIDSALSADCRRVLITTYTSENQRQIIRRIEQKVGCVPERIVVAGWFSFLISQCAKPFQRAIVGQCLRINGLNFTGRRNRFTPRTSVSYYLDRNNDMYRDGVADFVVELNRRTGGAVVRRLESIFGHIFVDEVQDLVGYDLDILDMLLNSRIAITMVGDPRQHTFATNMGPRNKQYRGIGLLKWFSERRGVCHVEERSVSYRCNQQICDFADAIYPNLPKTTSKGVERTGHDGVFLVPKRYAVRYFEMYRPVTVLRYSKRDNTLDLPAMNIGVSKGSTFDRVMIFPTEPMLTYLKDRDEKKLRSPEKLYVAVTRARYSVAFVVPDHLCGTLEDGCICQPFESVVATIPRVAQA